MSRDERVAVVESFLNCIASGELDRLPIAPELTVESPLTPKLSGAAAMEYVKAVSAASISPDICGFSTVSASDMIKAQLGFSKIMHCCFGQTYNLLHNF